MAIGGGKLLEPDGWSLAPTISRDDFAPDALGAVYLDAVHFLRCKMATQTLGGHPVKFDLLRRKADGRMQPGGASPEAPAAASC